MADAGNTVTVRSEATGWYVLAMEQLVAVVQALSQARTLDAVTAIVRRAARELTGAEGATFVLRDSDQCHYVDEDAISPLWKGQRFPMRTCISGWVMANARAAVIEDIYTDPRIPADAYRPTFVKSLAMVPIRKEKPVGAIGNYWANKRIPSNEEVAVLQALADVTSVTLENIDLYGQLQDKMLSLEESNEKLKRFAWGAAHDLKSPLRAIDNLAQWLEDDLEGLLADSSRKNMERLRQRVQRMSKLLDDILEYSSVDQKASLDNGPVVSGEELIENVLALIYIPPAFSVNIGRGLQSIEVPLIPLQRVLCNVVSNAIKHHDGGAGVIDIDVEETESRYLFSVADDGPGIALEYREKIFEMFQTLKPRDVVEGSGMGLAIAKRLVDLNGGEITVNTNANQGSRFEISWLKEV